MQNPNIIHNSDHIFPAYFEDFLRKRFNTNGVSLEQPSLGRNDESAHIFFTHHLQKAQLQESEVFLLILTLLPHIAPSLLDRLFAELLGEGNFPQLGGVRGKQHRGILPTGEMALFLLAKDDAEERAYIRQENGCAFGKKLFQQQLP